MLQKLRSLKLFSVFALALILCFAGILPAAANPVNPETITEAGITKILQMPVGTVVPATTFTFNVTSVSVDSAAATATNMPVIGNFTATFDGTETPDLNVGNTNYYIYETTDIFAGVTWPHAGEFVYTVTEVQSGYTGDGNGTMTYSQAVYTLTVHVRNGANGLEIFAIGAMRTTEDDGTPDNEKVDPTPGGGVDFDFSQMIFTNTYVRNHGPLNPIQDSTLEVSKTVTGELGNQTLMFDFSMTVIAPTLVYDPAGTGTPPVFRAHIVENGATVGNPIDFTSGVATPFQLRHGQSLRFIDTHVGTTYTVTEAAVHHYIASVSVIVNGGTPVVTTNPAANTALPASGSVGETVNSAAFTNNRPLPPITGLVVENLPFVGLIALAIGSFVAFIAVKSRKKKTHRA